MKDKEVGIYTVGYARVKVYLVEGSAGNFRMLPEGNGISEIRIGIDQDRYQDLLEVMLHEIDEFVMTGYNCRYIGSQIQTREVNQYVFSFTHAQFSDMKAIVAEFLSEALFDIHKIWKKWRDKKNAHKLLR